MNHVLLGKAARVVGRKVDALVGRMLPLQPTLDSMSAKPFELHLELTNLCNANCVFCPYQYQERAIEFMSDEVLLKAAGDFVKSGGGSVGLTPVVGDALIHPKFVEYVRTLRSMSRIDRLFVTTNAILVDKHGVDEILDSGLTSVTISTAGFDKAMYERVYRSHSYERMRNNVLALVRRNAERGSPVHISIGLRPDRPLDQVMRDPDFQPILEYQPTIDFTWSFTSAGGRVTREALPAAMRLRRVESRREACVQLYNGPIVLPNGTVMACSCVASMDAAKDLGIGNVMTRDLREIWIDGGVAALRGSFADGLLNPTCAGCDMYRNLELYRTVEGRRRAAVNRRRAAGEVVRRNDAIGGPFAGG
ncbi:MAG: radical SAM/SPASM domain-containing protein [Vicinamibacterales bacterium]